MSNIPNGAEEAIDFSVIADLFLSYGSLSSPSFFDGRMVASLGLSSEEDDVNTTDEWLREVCIILGVESPRTREDAALILGWRSQAKAQLGAEQMDYEPLLPDELFSLSERAEALKSWASGFSEVLDDHGRSAEWSEALTEALDAMKEISQLDLDEGIGDDAETEADLIALTEHVRITALTLYIENHPGQPHVLDDGNNADSSAEPPQIH